MSVTEDAIAQIKAMIVSGSCGPVIGYPASRTSHGVSGLSRNSLREAVRALSWIRILDVRQGDGTYVTSLDPELLVDAMSFIVDLHHDRNVMHILEARRVLEAAAAALAAQYVDDGGAGGAAPAAWSGRRLRDRRGVRRQRPGVPSPDRDRVAQPGPRLAARQPGRPHQPRRASRAA